MIRFSAVLLIAGGLCAQTSVQFNRDVRPILSDKCFTCHGPDAAAKKVPFRLDRESFAKADLGQGRHAIVPGDPASSGLIKRITTTSKALRMPPAFTGLQLTDREIDTLIRWVEQGAKWELHWSFIPPGRPNPPPVKNAAWIRNPIDRFILSRLEREGLAPQKPAPREILLRRASLDLTGLPPSPSELDAFLNDQSPQAFEKAVDRLLASPRYGERMAARWLDAARYADTNGYQYDGPRQMWRWRDWVIDAFNSNLPYDRFTVEQLAGDLLSNPSLDQRIATGFNRNHRMNTEDGIVPDEYFVEQVVDRVETTSTVFLGLTLGCARCHNHKYDSLTQTEFYQFFAFFNNLPELGRGMKYGNTPPLIPAPTKEQQAQLDAFDRKIQSLEASLKNRESEIHVAQAAWEQRIASESGRRYWGPSAGLLYTTGRGPQTFDGQRVIDAGDVAPFDIADPFTISAWLLADATPDGSVASRMIDNPKGKGYGLHLNHGRVHVNITNVWADDAVRVESEETLSAGQWHHVVATVDGSRLAAGVRVWIDGQPVRLRIENATLYRPFRNAGAKVKEPFLVGGGWGKDRRFRGQLEDVRVYSRALSVDEVVALSVRPSSNEIARKPAANRTPAEADVLRRDFLETDAPEDLRSAARRIPALRLERELAARGFPSVMVMEELPQPRDAFLLQRGAYDKPGEKVSRGVPAVLPALPPGAPNNRLGLAQWLVNGRHPLTARVAVNRLWQMMFGVGLVKTTEDFGVQGEWPSHPELLDWLATEFIRNGWDTKAILKLMVTSAAYGQSSQVTPELSARDPENRLLARGPRFRLPAEMIRDQALFAAGLLVEKVGGPSVMPYQPAGLWKETAMQDMDYVQGHGADLYRRSLYTFWKRTIAPPMMINFDAAGRETCVVRDSRTNTPLQALDLMNDVTFVEASRAFAQRMIREGGAALSARLRYGFRLVTSRWPSADEERVLRESLAYHTDYFASNQGAAPKLLAQGEWKADPSFGARELAAYASVASLLLNLDEVVTKQ